MMKTPPASSLTAIPAPYAEDLATVAPSIVFEVSRSLDPYHSWDGDGPDPRDDGFSPYDIDVTAETIVRGKRVQGAASLGDSYFRPTEPTGDIHGYLLQLLDNAAKDLRKVLKQNGDLVMVLEDEILNVRSYLSEAMQEAYNAQHAKIGE